MKGNVGGLLVLAVGAFIIMMGIFGSQHALFPKVFGPTASYGVVNLLPQIADPNSPSGSIIPLPFTKQPFTINNPNNPSGSNIPLPVTGQPLHLGIQ